jgi:hypothetical protein
MSQYEDSIGCARSAYIAAREGVDLVTIKAAAQLVERTPATIRKWIRSGDLDSVRTDPTNNKSPIMVGRQALLAYVATSGKKAKPARTSKIEGSTKAVLAAELEGAKALSTALQGQMDLLHTQLHMLKEMNHTERNRAEEWKDRATKAEAELGALRRHQGLTWWKRLLTTDPTPQLEPA